MKAITVRQPWAHAIIYMGKDIENRARPSSYRGPLLIHAAKTMADIEYEKFVEACQNRKLGEPPTQLDLRRRLGGIIGIVDLVDCVQTSTSKWFIGPYGLVLKNPRQLPFRPWRGQLGLYNIPEADLWNDLG